MTLEEFENWLSDKDIKKIPIDKRKDTIEYYCCGHLALEMKRNYYGRWILTIFKLVKWVYEISSETAMCKELYNFDIEDLDYYFDAYIRQAQFLELYMKKQEIYKKKRELSKDFS